MTELVEDVLTIIAEKGRVGRERLVPEARLMELNIASLDVIEIIFALEERFDIEIPFNANDAASGFNTVGDVIGAVERAVASPKAAPSATPSAA
ncbi:acyl carrier protein [Azospirillum sp. SYSU D00513]|uniref:acyl carrier protein n=1 Tax=Azospirillum sp. SYSU D00513 TaxID=2812561 RepID=UPI001A96DCA9|nr:acyl carrier protein [Azospirillum sp. SYSU D00513]